MSPHQNRLCALRQITAGEPIHLKESSGPVRGQARAGEVRFFADLTADQIERIRLDYNDGILGEDDFWETHADCRYATLITLEAVQRIEPPYRIDRKGMRAWIVCAEQSQGETWVWAICLRASAAS